MNLPKRKSPRLKDFDYSSSGAYFITICTQNKACLLSRIVGEGLAPPATRLTNFGKVAQKQINQLENRFPSVCVDKYVIMPNHIHLILRLRKKTGGASPSPTVSEVIGAYKSLTTRICKHGNLFQRSFYDHVIREDDEYLKIWEYIDTNPAKWTEDCFYSE